MSCESVRNKLVMADPRRLPAGLRDHVAGCDLCGGFVAELAKLDEVLAALPVPPCDPAVKAKFLASLADAGPIITRVPTVPRRDSGVTRTLLEQGRWRYPAGLAASVALALGGVWWANRPPAQRQAPAEVAVRHDLLGKEVRHLVALTKSNDPKARLTEFVGVAGSLEAEARQMYLIADAEAMTDLQKLFEKAVVKGVVTHAERLPAADRAATLPAATAALQEAQTDAAGLAKVAPEHTRPMLEKMAKAAKTAHERLDALLKEGA